jgi:hypothetical protein
MAIREHTARSIKKMRQHWDPVEEKNTPTEPKSRAAVTESQPSLKPDQNFAVKDSGKRYWKTMSRRGQITSTRMNLSLSGKIKTGRIPLQSVSVLTKKKKASTAVLRNEEQDI